MDALDQMFQVLVRTIRSRHPALLTAPFTVGEVYSQILPYRHFRRELGLETNQEYEVVLGQLLSGARGYLDVDEQLRDQLGKAIASPSFDTSRIREFAEAHVSLNAAAADRVARPATPAPGASATASTPARANPTFMSQAAPIAEPRPASTDDFHCRFCGGELPADRPVNFCPRCGQNLQILNCPACGSEVESGWRFCISCGKAVG